jgi:hypothetical protein
MDLEQVMGPREAAKEIQKMAPDFLFDGENTGQFLREFPVVMEHYGISPAFTWEDDKELNEAEQRMNTNAMTVLRRYVTEDIVNVITTGRATRASVMYKSLRRLFMPCNARTKLDITREIMGCEMRMGESVVGYFGRIKALINELLELGEELSSEYLKITVTARLRSPFREAAEEKMDRDRDISLEDLMAYVIDKQRKEKKEVTSTAAFVGNATGNGGGGSGRNANGGESFVTVMYFISL